MGLYQTWLKTLHTFQNALAVKLPDGESWSFRQLQQHLEDQPALKPRTIHHAFASEGTVPFIVETLRAWRDDAILCPLESEFNAPSLPDPAAMNASVAHLKFTSGSTGEPRCVMFVAEQLAADAENIRVSMGLDRASPNLSVISPAHSYGFSNLVLPLLLQGHPLVVAGDILPAALRNAAKGFTSLTLPAVPAMWRAWHRVNALETLPIKLAISAGAPLPVELEQEVYDSLGLKIHNFMGSSECGAIAYDDSLQPRADAAFVGRPAHGVNISINQAGCIVVQSHAVGAGYTSDNATQQDALHNGRFVTSDLAELRQEGLYLLGRASDAINLAGRKLNPSEVEAALLKHPEVKHCVVFGVPSKDAFRHEETVACIHGTCTIPQKELAGWLEKELPAWKRPRHYWFTTELKPDARGKFPRRIWKERWLQDHRAKNLSLS